MLCLESKVHVTFGVYKQLKTHLHFFDDFSKFRDFHIFRDVRRFRKTRSFVEGPP